MSELDKIMKNLDPKKEHRKMMQIEPQSFLSMFLVMQSEVPLRGSKQQNHIVHL